MDFEDQNYYKPQKFNKPWVGLMLGIIFPLICFVIYYFVKTKGIVSFKVYYEILMQHHSFVPVLSLCVIPNLLLYFLFKKLDYWYSIKGVITSIFIYTLLVVVLKFS